MVQKNAARPRKSKDASVTIDHDKLLVVGIGASAGGIPPLKEFFSLLPPDTGMAFVVVLHISPNHTSNLAEILQTQTKMPVTQVSRTVKVLPDRVYVIPPNKNLSLVDGVITLTKPDPTRGSRVAIDHFFRTLANAYHKNAVCIVMSGSGSDGTIGLRQIKESDGLAIVQDPKTAQYDSMPRSAIETNLVDWILPVAEMPAKLQYFGRRFERAGASGYKLQGLATVEDGEELEEILRLIRIQTGHDFSNYKMPTILRRVSRHLQIKELASLGDYVDLLKRKPEEVVSLVKNILINVTNFFRDKESFDALEQRVIPKLFEGKTGKDQIRVWSVGCASGEEAYSLAILLSEYAESLSDPPKIQVFATDVDDDAIGEGRENRYPETIEGDVAPDRLQRAFIMEHGKYRVKKAIRETVLFAPHNILSDPPFSRVDLIACRNLLIYLNRETQEKVLEVFHFALREDGYLFLGNSESNETYGAIFGAVDKKQRIFKRRPSPDTKKTPLIVNPGNFWMHRRAGNHLAAVSDDISSFGDIHYKLVEQYAPPSVLVNDDFDIVHVSETAGRYLRFAGGEPSKNLLKAVSADIMPDLRAALLLAKQSLKITKSEKVRAWRDDTAIDLVLTVKPTQLDRGGERYLLVVFEEVGDFGRSDVLAEAGEDMPADRNPMESIIERLEHDLQSTKRRLGSTIEQHETSTEELKASNEELQAVNEELRSTSEELETGKEELQSVNEELTTVNQDLKEKVDETNLINADLNNLMASTEIGTIFLDLTLRIKRYTPTIERIFNIIPSDINRPLGHLTHRLDYRNLAADCAEVVRARKVVQREVSDVDHHWYLLRILPYKSGNDRIEGVVVTFIDITDRLEAEKRLRWLATVVESSNDAIFSFAFDQNIVTWNRGAEKIFGYLAGEAIGNPLSMLTQPGRELEQEHLLTQTWGGDGVENFETVQLHKSGGAVDISLNLAPILDENKKIVGMMATVRDITKRKAADESLRESEERLRLIMSSVTDFAIVTTGNDGVITDWNTGAEKLFGYGDSEIIGKSADILFTPEDRKNSVPEKEMATARETGRAEDERVHLRKDGSRFMASGIMSPLRNFSGGFVKIARDLSGRIEGEAAIREREMLKRLVAAQEDERQRIARDLHDQLGQQLTALRLKLESLKLQGRSREELEREVEELQRRAEKIDADVSFLAWELRPSVLDDLGLRTALGNFVREFSRNYEIPVDFHTAKVRKKRLTQDIEVNLYRIAQEALNNVVKHAAAATINVLLEYGKKEVVLIVEDDGSGFDADQQDFPLRSGKGLGLIGMRERCALIGGRLEVESAPGHGTTIFARVPIRLVGEKQHDE